MDMGRIDYTFWQKHNGNLINISFLTTSWQQPTIPQEIKQRNCVENIPNRKSRTQGQYLFLMRKGRQQNLRSASGLVAEARNQYTRMIGNQPYPKKNTEFSVSKRMVNSSEMILKTRWISMLMMAIQNILYMVECSESYVHDEVSTFRMLCNHMKENRMLRMEKMLGICPYMESNSLHSWKLQMVSYGTSMQIKMMAGTNSEIKKMMVEETQQHLQENDDYFQQSSGLLFPAAKPCILVILQILYPLKNHLFQTHYQQRPFFHGARFHPYPHTTRLHTDKIHLFIQLKRDWKFQGQNG